MVEDDPEIVRLNSRMLSRRGFHVTAALSAAEARAQMAGFDLAILDVNLPDGSGYDLCRELRAAGHRETPVIFLTGRGLVSDKVEGFSSGGDYYLVKPYSFEELFAVIGSLLRRSEQTKISIAEATEITRGPLTLRLSEGKAYVDGRDAGLTPKEFAVLLLLVRNEDREMGGEEIYRAVWGADPLNGSGTVRQHISRLKKKLGEDGTDAFSLLSSREKGYLFTVR
ncbi:MAG: response regulator transcription factor [Oscillospiraceae bacterium]|jgi:two-component system catabolic regulation response regulator CreB|nr:response regulator transcription factor [Oscillospiraceae bacterium]